MTKNKCWIAVMKDGKPIKKYSAVVIDGGKIGKLFFKGKTKKIVKVFKPNKGKPVVRMMLEQVILKYPNYDPAVHGVTLLNREG